VLLATIIGKGALVQAGTSQDSGSLLMRGSGGRFDEVFRSWKPRGALLVLHGWHPPDRRQSEPRKITVKGERSESRVTAPQAPPLRVIFLGSRLERRKDGRPALAWSAGAGVAAVSR
jgi:hypothetical protein